MSGADPPEAQNYTGFKKFFNSETFVGRANIAKATYGAIGLFILYKMVCGGKKKQ